MPTTDFMNQHITQNLQRAAGFEEHSLSPRHFWNFQPETQLLTNLLTPTNMSSTQPESAHIKPVDDETPDETSGITVPLLKLLHLPRLLTDCQANYSIPNPNSGT